jgi:hypothetical protein
MCHKPIPERDASPAAEPVQATARRRAASWTVIVASPDGTQAKRTPVDHPIR